MWGINLGYDYSGPHHVLGFAANISGDSLTYAPGTMSGHNMVYALATYGGWQLGPLHLTGQFAYDFGHMSANKTITAGTVVSTANGHSGEHLFKATSTAGFLLKAAGMQVEPFVGIDYMKGKISGFTEAGAGGADLTVNPISADRTDLLAGLSVTRAEGTWRPDLRATWRSENGNGPDRSVTAFFNGDTTTSFTLAGVPAAKQELDANRLILDFPEDGIQVLNGRYGPYITDKVKNAKIPKDRDPKSLTREECRELIAAAPIRPKRGAFGRPAAKTEAKAVKTAAPAKSGAVKKAPAKKTAKRKTSK